MTTAAPIRDELTKLTREGESLLADLRGRRRGALFEAGYQSWYTRALPVVKALAADRYAEFRSYYEIGSTLKRGHWSHAYVIQHYLKGIDPFVGGDFDIRELAANCFSNQLAIFRSLMARLDYALADLDDQALFRLQQAELETARGLIKVSSRAAGALAGAVVENHLQHLARRHRCRGSRHKPGLAELNGALHAAGVLDSQVHRQLSWMADVRERCIQKQEQRPTRAQVRDLVDGAHWLIKNVF